MVAGLAIQFSRALLQSKVLELHFDNCIVGNTVFSKKYSSMPSAMRVEDSIFTDRKN
jgi:hypothetical protein